MTAARACSKTCWPDLGQTKPSRRSIQQACAEPLLHSATRRLIRDFGTPNARDAAENPRLRTTAVKNWRSLKSRMMPCRSGCVPHRSQPNRFTIRLLGLASVWIAAISSSPSSKSNTARFSAMRSGLVVRDKATTPSCWTSHRRTIFGIVRAWLSAISAIVGSVNISRRRPSWPAWPDRQR